MRVCIAALLWAAALVTLQLSCSAQEVSSQGAPLLDSVSGTGALMQGMLTSGTTKKETLASIPPYQGAVKLAVVVPAPPRFGRQPATTTVAATDSAAATAAGSVSTGTPAVNPEDAATAAAAAAAATATALPESKVGPAIFQPAPTPETVMQQAAVAAGVVTTMDAAPATYQGILDKHNYYRSWHGVPALTWSASLARDAAAYAGQCVWGHDPNNRGQGENLYAYGSSDYVATLKMAIDGWYNEVSQYSFDNPGFSSETGHFTQVVWKGSLRLGCAVAVCGSGFAGWSTGGSYVVCRYDPPGNVLGQFEANVFPRQANPPPTPPPTPPPPSPKPAPKSSPRPSPKPSPKPTTPPPSSPPASPPPPSPPAVPAGTLPEGYMIRSPGCLVAPNSLYWICMQDDGNLVLFNSYRYAIWASDTAGASNIRPFSLVMQRDGNLRVYDSTNTPLWQTNTAGRGTAPRRFQVQSDGNALIADSQNRATWATYTAGQ